MSQKRAKIHHIVPQILQKQFCNDQGKIWFAERQDGRYFREPELRNTRSAFKIKDYYTIIENGIASDIVEKDFYGKIDDYLGDMLPNVLGAFSRGQEPTFDGKALDSLHRVVFEMVKRTPDFIKDHSDTEVGREYVEGVLAKNEEKILSPEEEAKLKKTLEYPCELKKLGRDIRNRATMKPSTKTLEALSKYTVRWARSYGKHSFILSSLMVYRIGNGGPNGLINPNSEFWFPISKKISLVLLRDDDNKIPLVVSQSRNQMREVNNYAASNSSQVGSYSKEHLLKHIRTTTR